MIEYLDYARTITQVVSFGNKRVTDILTRYNILEPENLKYSDKDSLKKIKLLISEVLAALGTLGENNVLMIDNKEFSNNNSLNLDNDEAFIEAIIN